MGGAPPLPLNFAPQVGKKGLFRALFTAIFGRFWGPFPEENGGPKGDPLLPVPSEDHDARPFSRPVEAGLGGSAWGVSVRRGHRGSNNGDGEQGSNKLIARDGLCQGDGSQNGALGRAMGTSTGYTIQLAELLASHGCSVSWRSSNGRDDALPSAANG